MNPYETLQNDLAHLGVCEGDVLLMHCSFKAIGGSALEPAKVFDAILDLLGAKGTLVVPSLSYDFVTENQPYFNVKTTPSCIGFLPEYFRTQVPGVLRSKHPTHSCCAKGFLAEEIVKGHERDVTPVGEHSPFRKTVALGGKILLLGSPYDRNTLLHGAEEAVGVRYVFHENLRIHYQIDDGEGNVTDNFGYRHWLHENGRHLVQKYSRLIPLLPDGVKKEGNVLGAKSVVFRAKEAFDIACETLRRDPLAFVAFPEEDA